MAYERTIRDVHVNTMMTNVAVSFALDPAAFIAFQVAPIVTVAKLSDLVPRFGKEAWILRRTKRAPGTEAGYSKESLSTIAYTAQKRSWKEVMSDEERDYSDPAVQPEMRATKNVTKAVMLSIESEVATTLTTTSNYASSNYTTLTGTAQWSDQTSGDSNPVTDIETAKEAVIQMIGTEANTAILGRQVYTKIRTHPIVRDYFKYTTPGPLPEALIKTLFGVDKLLIGKIPYLTSAEGQTETGSFVWGKHCILAYTPSAPGLDEPALAYSFTPQNFYIKQYRDENVAGSWIEANIIVDPGKPVGLDSSSKIIAGYLIANAVA